MNRLKWIDRKFSFNYPVELYPEIIERVRGASARLDEYFNSASAEILTRRDGDHWSIQENAGHLFDLDALTLERIEQYVAGVSILHAADITNRKTSEANYNNVPAATIASSFRERRIEVVNRLESLDAEMFARSAIHPRLNIPMRLVDFVFFEAEHDDYHFTRINELLKLFGG
ncbi:MAG TPA: DinB family protein [Pyrinomonadaceae bacterium]|nr:DinB family protein [Pyrinomonadaceae bacterium]